MRPPSDRVWRAFPWDPNAREGDRFSATYVPSGGGFGRFDLQEPTAGVLYAAETPEHAIAECVQHYRGQALDDVDLVVAGHRLALVSMALPTGVQEAVADLCDPRMLIRLRIRPDETASRHRPTTQRIAVAVYRRGHTGLRWWSAFSGDWHTVVLFGDRLDPAPAYAGPEPISLGHPALRDAAFALGLRLPRA